MEFLNQHIIAPTAQHMALLEFLGVVVYAIHLPYIAMVMGATAVAMWLTFSDHEILNPRFARLAGDLIDAVLGSRFPMLVLGVLPLFVLPFIYTQWFVGANGAPLKYIVFAIPGVIVSFVILGLYRGSFAERKSNFHVHMGLGTLGLGALMASYFVLLSTVARLHDPEKWFRLKNLVILLLNWNVIWKFLFFVHLAFAITGAAMLFFLLRWSGERAASDREYAAFVRKFGAGIGLAFSFALPVFYLFYVFTSPDVVFDNTNYLLAASVVFVSMVLAYSFFGALQSREPRFGATTFSLFVLVFVLAGSFDMRAMANANREHARVIEQAAEKAALEREVELETAMAAASGKNLGEETFTKVCMQCHRFEEKLVGPPLSTVLPKYNAESLKAYLLSPVKVDPAYPPMPNPGLTPAQAAAVAAYELQHLAELTGGATAPTETQTTPAEPAAPTH
ncbi:MAG: c-type cytochrome [Candidatus Latescibacteria bacterium]|nr:c-type cytochrome [Candidatus Latescibacterota bacterium]